jgi:hypothetical protein
LASLLAPAGIAHLLYLEMTKTSSQRTKTKPRNEAFLSVVCLLTVASSAVLLTDTLYVLDLGPRYGATLLVLSTVLVLRVCRQHHLKWTLAGKVAVLLLVALLIYDYESGTITFGHPDDEVRIEEGLYYDGKLFDERKEGRSLPVSASTF